MQQAKVSCDAGNLDLSSGLLVILDRALLQIEPGEVVAVRASDPSVEHDLPAWCRVSGHTLLAAEPDGGAKTFLISRGTANRLNVKERPDWGPSEAHRHSQVPARADNATGFAPRGSVVEQGSPRFDFRITERDRVWAEETRELYEQATANQWNATKDIPWSQLQELPRELEESVCQVMTFLTENEYSALYVPAKFAPRIHPHFGEVVMFLATQMNDEARHIEVFTKRATANGGALQYSAASGQRSLKTLIDQEEFTSASFLLSVLGEGTFLDLLRFIEECAPDPATKELTRRARIDEARHVKFGMAHARHFIKSVPEGGDELVTAARNRAKALGDVHGVSAYVQDALAILAAGSLAPDSVRSGVKSVARLMATMHENRVKRLSACGFTPAQAEEMSTLHTPNFM